MPNGRYFCRRLASLGEDDFSCLSDFGSTLGLGKGPLSRLLDTRDQLSYCHAHSLRRPCSRRRCRWGAGVHAEAHRDAGRSQSAGLPAVGFVPRRRGHLHVGPAGEREELGRRRQAAARPVVPRRPPSRDRRLRVQRRRGRPVLQDQAARSDLPRPPLIRLRHLAPMVLNHIAEEVSGGRGRDPSVGALLARARHLSLFAPG